MHSLPKLTIRVNRSESGTAVFEKMETSSHPSLYVSQPVTQPALIELLESIHKELDKRDPRGFFAEPVTDDIAPHYSQLIKQPMDLGTMLTKLTKGQHYCTTLDYLSDALLMCGNAMVYNTPDTVYHQKAKKLAQFCQKQFHPEQIARVAEELSLSEELQPYWGYFGTAQEFQRVIQAFENRLQREGALEPTRRVASRRHSHQHSGHQQSSPGESSSGETTPHATRHRGLTPSRPVTTVSSSASQQSQKAATRTTRKQKYLAQRAASHRHRGLASDEEEEEDEDDDEGMRTMESSDGALDAGEKEDDDEWKQEEEEEEEEEKDESSSEDVEEDDALSGMDEPQQGGRRVYKPPAPENETITSSSKKEAEDLEKNKKRSHEVLVSGTQPHSIQQQSEPGSIPPADDTRVPDHTSGSISPSKKKAKVSLICGDDSVVSIAVHENVFENAKPLQDGDGKLGLNRGVLSGQGSVPMEATLRQEDGEDMDEEAAQAMLQHARLAAQRARLRLDQRGRPPVFCIESDSVTKQVFGVPCPKAVGLDEDAVAALPQESRQPKPLVLDTNFTDIFFAEKPPLLVPTAKLDAAVSSTISQLNFKPKENMTSKLQEDFLSTLNKHQLHYLLAIYENPTGLEFVRSQLQFIRNCPPNSTVAQLVRDRLNQVTKGKHERNVLWQDILK